MSKYTIYLEAGVTDDGHYWWKSLVIDERNRKAHFLSKHEENSRFGGIEHVLIHAAAQTVSKTTPDSHLTFCTSSSYLLDGILELKAGNSPHENNGPSISECWAMFDAIISYLEFETLKMPNEHHLLVDDFYGDWRCSKGFFACTTDIPMSPFRG